MTHFLKMHYTAAKVFRGTHKMREPYASPQGLCGSKPDHTWLWEAWCTWNCAIWAHHKAQLLCTLLPCFSTKQQKAWIRCWEAKPRPVLLNQEPFCSEEIWQCLRRHFGLSQFMGWGRVLPATTEGTRRCFSTSYNMQHKSYQKEWSGLICW